MRGVVGGVANGDENALEFPLLGPPLADIDELHAAPELGVDNIDAEADAPVEGPGGSRGRPAGYRGGNKPDAAEGCMYCCDECA